MKRRILSNGVTKEMTFEEVLKQFTPMINKATNIAIGKFGTTIEREDMIQEMHLETWKAYEEYNGQNAFSTFLHYKLMKVTGNEAQKITAQKRTSLGVLSMNATLSDGDDFTLEDLFVQEDYINENIIATEMLALIGTYITEREKSELKYVLYSKEYKSTHLSKALNISRQAAHLRIATLKSKLQRLLILNNFAYDYPPKQKEPTSGKIVG